MGLNEIEKRFIVSLKPRMLAEIECLKGIGTITYPDTDNEKLMMYRRNFLFNAFAWMAADMFFLSHSVFDKNVEQQFMDFCKKYQEIY